MASEKDAFVLVKRGMFWRPNSCGYTSNLLRAGIYYRPEILEQWWSGNGSDETLAVPLLLAIDDFMEDKPNPEIFAMLAARGAKGGEK